MQYNEKLIEQINGKKSCLVLGIDPIWDLMPTQYKHSSVTPIKILDSIESFFKKMIAMAEPYVVAIKIQVAYFSIYGSYGFELINKITLFAKEYGLLVIMDGKFNDIGSTAQAYALSYLNKGSLLEADAVTISPFLGIEGIEPFIEVMQQNQKGCFILLRTSNAGSDQLQLSIKTKLIEIINDLSQKYFSQESISPVGVVIGATVQDDLSLLKNQLVNNWWLMPGVGFQGGDLQKCLTVNISKTNNPKSVLIPLSRSVLYASQNEGFLEKSRQVLKKFYQEVN